VARRIVIVNGAMAAGGAVAGWVSLPLRKRSFSRRTDPAADVELHWMFRFARAWTYPCADGLVVQTGATAQRYRARLRGLGCIEIIHSPLPRELEASPLRALQDGVGGRVVAMG